MTILKIRNPNAEVGQENKSEKSKTESEPKTRADGSLVNDTLVSVHMHSSLKKKLQQEARSRGESMSSFFLNCAEKVKEMEQEGTDLQALRAENKSLRQQVKALESRLEQAINFAEKVQPKEEAPAPAKAQNDSGLLLEVQNIESDLLRLNNLVRTLCRRIEQQDSAINTLAEALSADQEHRRKLETAASAVEKRPYSFMTHAEPATSYAESLSRNEFLRKFKEMAEGARTTSDPFSKVFSEEVFQKALEDYKNEIVTMTEDEVIRRLEKLRAQVYRAAV